MTKGDIYYINLGGDSIGSEQKNDRFCVIIQNNIGNKYSPTTIVAMITSRLNRSKLPTHVPIKGCPLPSLVLCEQVRTIDKSRLLYKVGELAPNELTELNKALVVSFDTSEMFDVS